MIGLILQIGIPVLLLVVSWVTGRIVDRRHLARLAERERALSGIGVTNLKRFPGGATSVKPPALVVGEVAIATDYLKSFLASLRKIIGGEMKSYRVLLERARREALVRLLEEARRLGYDAVCNVRLETSDIGANMKTQGTTMVVLLACGTAYCTKPGPARG